MAKDKIGCCNEPAASFGSTNDPGAKLTPAGFTGSAIVGLLYQPAPECGPVAGKSFGLTRAEFIARTKALGKRVDPVVFLEARLKAVPGLYEYALTEPTGEG